MSDILICDICNKKKKKDDMFDWSTCQTCYNSLKSKESDVTDEFPCGKPENHNNGDNSSCAECIAIKNNL